LILLSTVKCSLVIGEYQIERLPLPGRTRYQPV
jgi:hypothetical protein